MLANVILSQQTAAGWLLAVSGLVFLPGGLLFTGRVIFQWPRVQTRAFLIGERAFVMAGILVAALGFMFLQRVLNGAGEGIISPVGLAVLLVGTVLLLAAESFSLSLGDNLYVPIVVAVVLSYLGQALFGAAMLRAGILPAWIGWTTLLWNLGWLLILPIARPHDMYYPWLHYVAPTLIGIALLSGR